MKVSIIIPTLNEEKNIANLLTHLQKYATEDLLEILVADAASEDDTVNIATKLGAKTIASSRGRAIQMNKAASVAKGDILYFVHADCMPPQSYMQDIFEAIENNTDLGCYRYKFDSNKMMLKVSAYFNRFEGIMCRGGDQTLFIKANVFNQLNGFSERHLIMEDYEFILRAQKKYVFNIIPKYAIVSARKYEYNSWLRVNIANLTVFTMFMTGIFSQQRMMKTYYGMIRHPR